MTGNIQIPVTLILAVIGGAASTMTAIFWAIYALGKMRSDIDSLKEAMRSPAIADFVVAIKILRDMYQEMAVRRVRHDDKE